MARLGLQRARNSAFSVLDRALAVARKIEIDPSVRENGLELGGDGKSLFGPRRPASAHPGLAKDVVRLRYLVRQDRRRAPLPRRLAGPR